MCARVCRGFFRGLQPTLLRAFPANAVIFCGFEWFYGWMDKII